MKNYFLKALLTWALALSLLVPAGPAGPAGAYEINTMPHVNPEMLEADYWINKIADPDSIIMSPEQIEKFNQEIYQALPYAMYNLIEYPSSFSGEQLSRFIGKPFPTAPSYIGSRLVGQSYWEKLRKQLNLEGLQDMNTVKYGFTVKRSNLKIFPTADIIGDEPNDPAFDLFQNSSILAAEPVVILHQSFDRQWYYVHMYNCPGWLPATDVAVCDRNTWINYQNEPEFLMVTGNGIKLDNDPLLPDISELEFTMGTRIPLVPSQEQPDSIRGRRIYQNYVVKLPIRKSSGQLEFAMALIPISNDVRVGYLPYTRANIIDQGFKMQGERYYWGGMLGGRDCSALVMELYRCFGFKLARNSEAQAYSAGKTLDFGSYSVAYREELLKNITPGASLHFPGHEMLYLGEDNGHYYVLNDLSSFAELKPGETDYNIIRTRTVVINDLDIARGSGKLWIEALTTAKLMEKTSFADLVNHPDRATIERMADNFVVKGISATEFNPDGWVTRAEFAVMLGRLLNLEPDPAAAQGQFNDISDQWYAGAVGAAVEAGLFTGSDDEKFHPEVPINRVQAAVILARAMKSNGSGIPEDYLQAFNDRDTVPKWGIDAINICVEMGLIKGKDQDRIAPLDLVTRAEAAVILDTLQVE